MQCDLDGNC